MSDLEAEKLVTQGFFRLTARRGRCTKLGLGKNGCIPYPVSFCRFFLKKPPAHLALSGFQRFCPLASHFSRAMIDPSANLNLENLIYIGFRAAAVATLTNPY